MIHDYNNYPNNREIHKRLKMSGLIFGPFWDMFYQEEFITMVSFFWFLQIYHFGKCTPKSCLLGHLMTTAINHTINNPTNLNQICHILLIMNKFQIFMFELM